MNSEIVIVLIVVSFAALVLLRSVWRGLSGKACSSCANCGNKGVSCAGSTDSASNSLVSIGTTTQSEKHE